jgi:molybdopterin-containing oxidoreductase family iron-sulfur binding subunit
MALVLYAKVGMPNASHAYNPWLHELPDPVTKAVWDNYACLSPAAAERLGVVQGDLLRLDVGGAGNAELPVLVQPGQHDGVVAVALGYGSELSRRFAHVGPQWIERKPTVGPAGVVGVNVVPLMAVNAGGRRFSGSSVNVTSTGRSYELALTQDYHSIDVPAHLAPPDQRRRPNIQETTLAAILHPTTEHGEGRGKHHEASLWPDDHQYTGHHWGMAIDLTTCTGCSACVVACQVENNVPVVGKDEVRRNREMHWIRIDRYYAGEGDDVSVSHQPMMCQHCDNAPCETVCPVLATVHSDEGLNQQVYNRCVGTRYCMNNCPYKVRRFNWFEYAHEDGHANMALNPDITIRSRGVMEKCSLCVQRIQEAKIEAKRLGKTVADGDIQTACQQSCPASAIVFGDMNDPQSALSKLIASDRHYRVLEELNVRPTVGYLEIVRNRPQADGGEHHG